MRGLMPALAERCLYLCLASSRHHGQHGGRCLAAVVEPHERLCICQDAVMARTLGCPTAQVEESMA